MNVLLLRQHSLPLLLTSSVLFAFSVSLCVAVLWHYACPQPVTSRLFMAVRHVKSSGWVANNTYIVYRLKVAIRLCRWHDTGYINPSEDNGMPHDQAWVPKPAGIGLLPSTIALWLFGAGFVTCIISVEGWSNEGLVNFVSKGPDGKYY